MEKYKKTATSTDDFFFIIGPIADKVFLKAWGYKFDASLPDVLAGEPPLF